MLAKHIQSVPPSGIRRFFDIAATMDDVISLGIGEPDFVTPNAVIDAAVASLAAGKTGYTSNAGLLELREAVAAHLNGLYGFPVEADQILITVGVSEAMELAMLALLNPGDEVLIPEPCFVSYGPLASFAHGQVVHVPTSEERNFEVTAEDIASRITSRTRMIFIGYPNNPTGAVLKRETLEEIAALAEAHDLILLSDEIYDQLIYGEAKSMGHASAWAVESLRERSIILGGFSKAYAMTGWRLGYAVAPYSIYKGLYKVHQYMVMSAPTMAQYGALAAIQECAPDVERMRRAYDGRRRVLVDSLRVAGLSTFEPEGAFYCFPDIRSTGLSSEDFAQGLIREESVAVVPGDAFGPSGEGFVRCSYATADDKVAEAGRRIARFAQKCRDACP
ncbi:MAG: aminotransferase class I/II-fold pyridoxal phosphate-dependent enzyme [Rhodothermaceae bacterium]|nr:aminotransferase class I/II-fold pyridoxal phosphate-dependent enzyme [Rhodothermaceae bacterium]MXX57548.1 aminotransferase class I/II-fold pyridoxal phosphate-dependent enzyme [Rhodothermaceae bacterium]MYD18236.1 aminotransferase class I/II-fold pyridoxal phosphate-dependent enzyme [Rhodothermaceae bacterium]MYD57752.1 aminotransferase class I/II-fold pyridoxal phosphate-dependent enzyme [Rhodothermaceae bacterium]MYI43386.1 aminotransferase class I/II-fold pyridoxal phosphate-dependent e